MSNPAERRELFDWLDRQLPSMVELLAELVNIDSGSYDQDGVNRVGEVLKRHLETRGITPLVIERPDAAWCLEAQVPVRTEAREPGHILLLGHRDTVFPKGEATARPFTVSGDLAFGPGVADMKSGLVLNTFVLEAFHRFGGHRHPIKVLYTTDEEIGSPSSQTVIEAAADGARAVFNAEPARVNGNVVTGRKGAIFMTIEVTGLAAHSGVAHEKGASAIEELCRKVQALHALTDYDTGTTVNVGLIKGGQSVNTVAPHAEARVDIRFTTPAMMAGIDREVDLILGRTHVEGTRTRVSHRAVFHPLEETEDNRRLFESYVHAAANFDLTVGGEYTGGSSDAGFTSVMGVPTLCGTGPVGAHSHQPEEVCYLSSFVPRAKALALTILGLE